MSIRIEAWKLAIPAVKTLAIAFAVAVGASGSAMAASEEPSFITRVQASQGVGPSGMVPRGDQASAMARASVVSEAASFITRVEMSQGIDQALSGATSEESARASVPGEATSFIVRVEMSQGIAPFQNRS
jgi:hypothetical protein